MTDPIADMLTRIRNAKMAGHAKLSMPSSKIKVEIARVMKQEGFLRGYKAIPHLQQGMLRLYLKYDKDTKPVIKGLKRVSKPGCRVYRGVDEMPEVLSSLGVAIVSTSSGVMTNKDCLRRNVGGEILCYLW
ncbi:30S ribosomal protein S8 [bacterium]|nr:30S ribosomal protein S8 [bacterium]